MIFMISGSKLKKSFIKKSEKKRQFICVAFKQSWMQKDLKHEDRTKEQV